MGKRIWTSSQKNAIDLRDGTVLVSAAAGSGKTAVLVERIIERITDEKNPCSADRLLVATFTNAAAAEMRERISSKISEMIEENPGNIRLQKQQLLLKRAKISTIDSFCNDIVRENFYRLGISPNFKISDDNETLILKETAILNVMDKLYENASPKFLELVEIFNRERDDNKLVSIVQKAHNFMRAYPFPEKWMEDIVSLYDDEGNTCDTVWGKVIVDYLNDALSYFIKLTDNSIISCLEDEKIASAYLEALKEDSVSLNLVLDAVKSNNWDKIKRAIKFEFSKLGILRGYNDNYIKIKINNNRKKVKDGIKKFEEYFLKDEESIKEENRKVKEIIIEIFKIVSLFDAEFKRLKTEKNMADFGDLEHFMINLLVDEQDGRYEKSNVALELSEQFDEIMVDECQDINETQNMIFKMLSKNEKNLFMVGDVKQSIYGFRQAMPEIFLSRKYECNEYIEGQKNYPIKIMLDKNFRSRKGVLDTVNFIFKQLMSKNLGDLDYTEEEKLKYGSDYLVSNEPETEIHIIETQNKHEEESDVLEAREIAKMISEMISEGKEVKDSNGTHKVKYRDFCILLRSANKHAGEYAKELNNCGIPVWCDANGKFFGTAEVSAMISLLRIIDNPIQDIPLLGVLVSPIYGFTPDDLTKIRIKNKDVPLYFALKECADEGDEACRKFLGDLNEYRRLSVMTRPSKLINYIYDKTGYLAIVQAMENGQLRLANLRLLAEYAGKYEGEAYKGLSEFIRFIDKLQDQKSDLTPASAISETANVVRIMSIHRSKGLEFPVCILAGCARGFNVNREEMVIHSKLGIGLDLRSNNNMVKYKTMIKQAILLEMKRDNLSEELRVLYVALTRAREKLIMVTTVKDLEDKINKIGLKDGEDEKISPYILRNMGSFSDWILCSALRHPSAGILRKRLNSEEFSVITSDISDWKIDVKNILEQVHFSLEENSIENDKINENLLKLIKNRFNYVYPYEDLQKLPVKVAASEISHNSSWNKYIASSRPAFLFKTSLTAAESGTAMHQFLQFADYKNSVKDFNLEVSRLLQNGFLSDEEAKVIDKEKILKFLSSDLGMRMLKSKNIMKEYRFSVRVPASEYSPSCKNGDDSDKIMLQGAIDCVFEEDGEYVIVDYKTDRVNDTKSLAEKYSNQLKIYKYAFEKCTDYKVKQCVIYSFSLGKQEIL